MLETTQTMITASALEVLARDQQQQEQAIGEDRLSYFLNLANNTGEKEFRDAVHDWKESHKDKDGKVDKTCSVRASEFQALFYANLHNASFAEMGYHAAVGHARKFLDSMGLRSNGKPILSEEEKALNREKNLKRRAANEAAKMIDFGEPDAIAKLQQLTEQNIAKFKADAENDALAKKFEKVSKLVDSIMADGEPYAMEVFAQLAKKLGIEVEFSFGELDFTEQATGTNG